MSIRQRPEIQEVLRRIERLISRPPFPIRISTARRESIISMVRTGTDFKENKHGHRVLPWDRSCQGSHIPNNLDLIFANTIFFVQSGYSTYVLRQASRRSWRIGQKRPVRVVYLHYANTAQESCLRLMGKKMLVSLALEGKFVADGIQALEDDDDILTSMARELVTQKDVGEKADAVWRQLQMQRPTTTGPAMIVQGPLSAESESGVLLPVPGEEMARLPTGTELTAPASLQSLAQFAATVRKTTRRAGYRNEDQLSLGF